MNNNNVLKVRELHNRGISKNFSALAENLAFKPLVCPFPRKFFAYIHDGMYDISCGVFPSYLDYFRWFNSLTIWDLFLDGIQFTKDQIYFTNVCRLG